MIDKNLSHDAATERMEMQAVADGNRLALQETQERFIDEGGGLQRVPRALVGHVMNGDAVQFTVHERNQPLQGGFVPIPPLDQQAGDIGTVFDEPIVAPLTIRPAARA